MKDNSTEFIKVTYFSNCLGDGKLRETNKCSGLRVGTRVTFTGKAYLIFSDLYYKLFTGSPRATRYLGQGKAVLGEFYQGKNIKRHLYFNSGNRIFRCTQNQS